jgi:4-amino-4-deoxy-L-arabinose transferase
MVDTTNLHEPTHSPGESRRRAGAARAVRRWGTSRPHLVLGVALVLLASAFQGSRGLYETDEGRYTDVALTMLDSHDWLVPHLDREHAIFTKPPLTYWALAASFSAFGRNEWAARLPNAIAFVVTGFLVLGLAGRFVPAQPWLGAATWAAMLAPTVAANVVSTDTVLTLWETLAMYAWTQATRAGQRTPRAWTLTMWLAWGLAMLTKGPVGLLPLVALGLALAVAQDARGLRKLIDPVGTACFAVVGLGWYAWICARRPGVLDYFIGYELYGRIFTPIHDRHPQWYGAALVYLPTLAAGALPWTVLAVQRLTKRCLGRRRAETTSTAAVDADRALLLWWLLVPLAVFVLSQSRLPLYVLPLFVPLALLIARTLAAGPPGDWRRSAAGLALGWLLALIGIKGIGAYVPRQSDHDARSFAVRLSQTIALEDVDEIAFVDASPFYGLRLYLDRNVEQIALRSPTTPFASFTSPQLLCDELREHERTVYLVRGQHERRRFEQALRDCGAYRATEIGHLRGFGVLTVAAARHAQSQACCNSLSLSTTPLPQFGISCWKPCIGCSSSQIRAA